MYPGSVPALMSKHVGNTVTNFTVWGGVIFNVKQYKAKGDGIADDTAAVAATIAAASVTGGIVYFPPGTYLISSRLTLPSFNIILEGSGVSSILKSKASTFAPTDVMLTAANKSNIIIRNLRFEGNGSLPTVTGSAPSSLYFQSCDNIIVEEVYMTNFMGIGIVFSGCTNCKVEKSKFIAIGQNQTGLSGKVAVPAVWSGGGCKDIKVIGNRFEDCRFSGVFHFSDGGEISGNTFEHIGESAIYTEYSPANPTKRTIITRNFIKDCYVVDITASGIECSSNNVIITENDISFCEGNGIGIGACSNVIASNNNCYNNNQKPLLGLPSSGILLQNIVGALNPDTGKNIIITNNNCYDDQTVHTQKYGIFVSVSGGTTPFLRSIIESNNTFGNTAADLFINPAVFNDASNIVRNNTAWSDYYRDIATVTQNTASTQIIKTYTIPAGSMMLNKGIRVKAFGTVTGTAGTKTIHLKHNNAVAFAFINLLAAENGQWSIEVEIFNTATNAQIRFRKCFLNNALRDLGTDTATVDTTIDQLLVVQTVLANAADTITCSGLIVERI